MIEYRSYERNPPAGQPRRVNFDSQTSIAPSFACLTMDIRVSVWTSWSLRLAGGPATAANESRNGRCPQRHWFCGSTAQGVLQSGRARNQEGAEVAAVQDPEDTVGAVSEVLAEARHAAQAVFPTPVATGPSWRVPAEDWFDGCHTIREFRCHGPCNNAHLDRHHLRVCYDLFPVRGPERVRNRHSAQESPARRRTSTLSVSFLTPILSVPTIQAEEGGPETR